MKMVLVLLALFVTSISYGQGIPVLEYHKIVQPSDGIPPSDMVVYVDAFNAQMKWLHDNQYTVITGADLVQYMKGSMKLKHPDKVVVISFDDGFISQQNALPALKQYGFKGTFSIIASYPSTDADYMNWNQIRELVKAGHDIESHSMTHPEQMQPSYYYTEINLSKMIIEQQIGKKVNIITWPNGRFNPKMIKLAREANYLGALTIDQDSCESSNKDISNEIPCDHSTGNAVNQDVFLMKRFFIDGRCTTDEIGKEIVQGRTLVCEFVHSEPQAASTDDK